MNLVLLRLVLCLFCCISRGYEYLLLNIAPGTSEEAMLEHLRGNLRGKLNDRGFHFARTTAAFSCREKCNYGFCHKIN